MAKTTSGLGELMRFAELFVPWMPCRSIDVSELKPGTRVQLRSPGHVIEAAVVDHRYRIVRITSHYGGLTVFDQLTPLEKPKAGMLVRLPPIKRGASLRLEGEVYTTLHLATKRPAKRPRRGSS